MIFTIYKQGSGDPEALSDLLGSNCQHEGQSRDVQLQTQSQPWNEDPLRARPCSRYLTGFPPI